MLLPEMAAHLVVLNFMHYVNSLGMIGDIVLMQEALCSREGFPPTQGHLMLPLGS